MATTRRSGRKHLLSTETGLPAVLVLLLGLTAALAYHARRAEASHRATAGAVESFPLIMCGETSPARRAVRRARS